MRIRCGGGPLRPGRLWRRGVAEVDAGGIGHAGTARDGRERQVRPAMRILVHGQQETGLDQGDRGREERLHLGKERLRGEMEGPLVDRPRIGCISGARSQFGGRCGQTDAQQKDGKAGGRGRTRRDETIVEARSGDDG